MRLLTLTAAALVAAPAAADEPRLPANPYAPQTAYAVAAAYGASLTLTVKLVEYMPATATTTVTEYVTQTKVVDGKQVEEKVPVLRTVQMTVMKPKGWRAVKLTLGDNGVSVH